MRAISIAMQLHLYLYTSEDEVLLEVLLLNTKSCNLLASSMTAEWPYFGPENVKTKLKSLILFCILLNHAIL